MQPRITPNHREYRRDALTTPEGVKRLARARGVALLALPGFVVYTVPLIGFLASLFLPLIASGVRPGLWPHISVLTSHVCSGLAVLGLWLPALVFLTSSTQVGSGATIWLIIPLCAPSGSAWWVLALLAISVYLAGLAASTAVRHPWPWTLGAWLAPLTYEAAGFWLVDADFAC
jgi:hypothetical protein